MREAKARHRADALVRRDAIPPAERASASRAIAARVLALPEWAGARVVAGYVPRGSEVDCRSILEAARAARKRVALPRVEGHRLTLHEARSPADLEPGAFGVPAPRATDPVVRLAEVDVLLVPGVAFDRTGHRLGYGRGYFDRLLAEEHGLTVGLGYHDLLVEAVPAESHDVRVRAVVTERETRRLASPPRARGA